MSTAIPELLELEVLELDDRESEHVVCGTCFPGHVYGRICTALCGTQLEEIADEAWEDDKEAPCAACESHQLCPVCGEKMWDWVWD